MPWLLPEVTRGGYHLAARRRRDRVHEAAAVWADEAGGLLAVRVGGGAGAVVADAVDVRVRISWAGDAQTVGMPVLQDQPARSWRTRSLCRSAQAAASAAGTGRGR